MAVYVGACIGVPISLQNPRNHSEGILVESRKPLKPQTLNHLKTGDAPRCCGARRLCFISATGRGSLTWEEFRVEGLGGGPPYPLIYGNMDEQA